MEMESKEPEKKDISLNVVDVTKDNFIAMWPTILFAVKTSTFIALDLELSGLGDRKKLNASCIEDRYIGLCKVAKSRSIISLGISCFQERGEQTDKKNKQIFKVQAFNLLLLCDDEYTVESQSLKFLVNHGFDFNKQYACGIPYLKGKLKDQEATSKVSIRRLIAELILAEKPVVLHNGLVDLVFFYECFFADLPSTLRAFVADLCELFPAGIFDTKYISEFHSRENLSVLEYLFRKCQYRNKAAAIKNDSAYIEIDAGIAGQQVSNTQEVVHWSLPTIEANETLKKYLPLLCKNFQERGFCALETSCTKIHSISLLIVGEEVAEQKQTQKRKRKRKSNNSNEIDKTQTSESSNGNMDENSLDASSEEVNCDMKKKCLRTDVSCADVSTGLNNKVDMSFSDGKEQGSLIEPLLNKRTFENILLPRLNGHRAGFDAFMTGYCFAFYRIHIAGDDCMQKLSNKIYLTGKEIPLNVMKSHFAKTSSQYQETIKLIKQN